METAKAPSSCCLPAQAGGQERREALRFKAGTGQTRAEFISLTGGWFTMGAEDGPHPEDGEGPAREVFVDSFALAATAVTVEEFSDFVSATGYLTAAERLGSSFVFHAFCEDAARFSAPVRKQDCQQRPSGGLPPAGF